jgi:site-specific DNA recombinase
MEKEQITYNAMPTKKVAIYLRKSRSDEGIEALRNHKAVLTRLAEGRGFEYEIFEEIGSAISLDIRDELNRLLSRLDEFSHVLVMDIDRLSRSIADMEGIKKQLQYHNVKILTPTQEIDLNNESQEMVMDFQSVIAKAEYQQIRKRMRIGKIEGARRGHWVNGVAPLGYKYDKKIKKLVINEQEYPLAREIFTLALKNMSYREIAINLNMRGYRTRSGNMFKDASIKAILINRAYVGDVVYRQKSKVKGGQDEVVIYPNAHPAIVTETEWLEVQRLIQSRRTNVGKTATFVKSAIQGLVYCGCCGAKLTIDSSKGETYIKGCWRTDAFGNRCPNKAIKAKVIEKEIVKGMRAYRDMVEERVRQLLNFNDSGIKDELIAKMEGIKEEVKRQESILKKLLDSYLEGIIDKDMYMAKKKEKEDAVKLLKDDIRRIELQLDSMDVSKQVSKLKQVLFGLDSFENMEIQEANRLLMTVIKRIEYKRLPDKSNGYRRAKHETELKIEWVEL